MSNAHSSGYNTPEIALEEHRSVNGINAKAVIPYTFDGTNLAPLATGLINNNYDYISASPNLTAPTTITFKKGGSSGTTVATLTFAYSGSDITSITRT